MIWRAALALVLLASPALAAGPAKMAADEEPKAPGAAPVFHVVPPKARHGFSPEIIANMRARIFEMTSDAPAEDEAPEEGDSGHGASGGH